MGPAPSVVAEVGGVPTVQFEQYVHEARQPLYRFAVVLCGDTVLAQDLLADVLGRAYERWTLVSNARDPHAYVRRMLVNEFMNWHRRRARSFPHAEVGDLVDRTQPAGPDHGDVHAERAALQHELTRLPARQRAAIVLRYWSDMDDDQIAAELGCRPGTVRSAISRGLATLRVNRAHQDDPEGPNR
ncbi:MAG: SigE family RNA polymerase sigma factor [Jatrophihabitans sp.]|uniref:SigE family RNA polymerase sigma factor n=1 Tax=Jatrophihabitans sp. TaxID=1932789 RepID=UPI003F7D4B64